MVSINSGFRQDDKFQPIFGAPGDTQATVSEKTYTNDAIDFTGALNLAGNTISMYQDLQNKEAAAIKDRERSAYRQMQIDKYQREIASDALYMEAYKEANLAAAAFEQEKMSKSQFELRLREIQDKYAGMGIGKADQLHQAITNVASSKGIQMSYDLYKMEQEEKLKRRNTVRTTAIDTFKGNYAIAKNKTDEEVEKMMQTQQTFADIADRSLLWYQQASADGTITEDEKGLLAKNFANAGTYNIAIAMGEEVAEFFKNSPEVNEQNLFQFKNGLVNSLTLRGVDRNMAIMAADGIADRFGLTDTIKKVNEHKISVKTAIEYERDVQKAITEGQEEKFKAFVGPGYSMFMQLPDIQKIDFMDKHPEAYERIMKAVNDSILNGSIQDNSNDAGATELSVKALELGLLGQTGDKAIDAQQATSALTGAVNKNTLPDSEEAVATVEGFEKAKGNMEVLQPHITNTATIDLVANHGTPETKAAYANKLGEYLKSQAVLSRQSLKDSQWKDSVRYDSKNNRFVLKQDPEAGTMKNLSATYAYTVLDRLNSTLSQIDTFTVMSEGQRQIAKKAFINTFKDMIPDLAETEEVDEPNFLNTALVFGDKTVEAIKKSSETPGTVTNIVREAATDITNKVIKGAKELLPAPAEAITEGFLNILDPDYTGSVEEAVQTVYEALPEELKTDAESFFKSLTSTETPVMKELKKIALNPLVEFGKEIVKNPLMSGEEWDYKYGKEGVVTKAYKQAWKDVKEGVKVVVDYIKDKFEEPTQYEKKQTKAFEEEQRSRGKKLIEEVKKRK